MGAKFSLKQTIRRDLLILWVAVVAIALVLMWLLFQLSSQGSASQIAFAQQQTVASCEALRIGAFQVHLTAPKTENAAMPSAALAVIDLALHDQPGVEGGFWGAQSGVLAYAFPTYDGTGIKHDPPSAELERISSTAQRALNANTSVYDVRMGFREAVVFAACPVEGDAFGLTAWTLKRVPLMNSQVMSKLTIAIGLLLGLVIVSGLWLGWMLSRWHSKDAKLTQQLAQAERMATLGRVSAGLAHEIRNPLGTMRMKAENALAAPADVRETRFKSALEVVLSQTARLESLVSSLLALTQPFHVERKAVNLKAWLHERQQTHNDAAVRSGVSLSFDIDEQTEVDSARVALIDPVQMARALDNLILNALAHTQAFGTIELGARHTSHATLLLWVADSGVGIPSELMDSLFDPFTTARPGGTGLGLALVREIVLAHDGSIRLVDAHQGTRIEMELPWPAS